MGFSANQLVANQAAERRLASLVGVPDTDPSSLAAIKQHLYSVLPAKNLSLLLTPNEVNASHGTGILAYRLMRETPNVAVMRSYSHYDNSCLLDVPDLVLPRKLEGRRDIFHFAASAFRPGQIKQVVCIPWHAKELQLAIALKQIFQCRFVLYVMDDNCLFTTNGIPHALMAEAMALADLVLAIGPEMQTAYQNAFRQKIWILPPLLEPSLLLPDDYEVRPPASERHGVVVGNIWRQASLDLFCDALIGTGVSVDWYCNTSAPGWLKLDKERLSDLGINFRAPLPEPELIEVLRGAPFAILPSSTLAADDTSANIGRLSLPSRVPFIAASAAVPIIVLGSDRTSAGAFVKHFELGVAADYTADSVKAAVETVTQPGFRQRVLAQAKRIGPAFSATGMAAWMEAAAANGAPVDQRFESLLSYRRDTDFGYFIPVKAPANVVPDFQPVYESLIRLKDQGFSPEFVLDVGASTGVWSATVARVYPDARYVLVDPLFGRYPEGHVESHLKRIGNAQTVNAAVSDQEGAMEIEVSDNVYGSSLLGIGSGAAAVDRVTVPVTTLAAIARDHALDRGGLVKIDVQFAEHMVIAGGKDFLSKAVDCIVIELTIERVHSKMKTMLEVLNQLDALGFQWADQAGEWRTLADGRLEQVDVVLVRKGLFKPLAMMG